LHLDLVVTSGDAGDGLVLENKVLARPDEAQLRRYYDAVRKASPAVAENSRFVLLSLLPPVFEMPEPWHRIGYGEFSAALQQVCDDMPPGFDADFTREYAKLAGRLCDLGDQAGLCAGGDPFYLDAVTDRRLEECGLRDLVLKLRTVELVQRVIGGSHVRPGGWWEAQWSRDQPLASRYTAAATHPILGTLHLGWQLQGRQLRLAALLRDPAMHGSGPDLRAKREWAAENHLTFWLHSGMPASLLPGKASAYGGKLPYNHYAPDMVYRYWSLSSDVRPADLVDALVALSHAADEALTRLAGAPPP
jgi:hypothetical protein